MLTALTRLIIFLDHLRLGMIMHKRRHECRCLCDLCTVEDCPAKQKLHHADIA